MPWPDMPKHLGKDAFFQKLEERYKDRGNAQAALAGLRNTGQHIYDVGSVRDAFDHTPSMNTARNWQQIVDHFEQDWFDNSPPKQTTGWWINWKGEAEKTLRQLLRRALEVSLGLSPTDAVSTVSGEVSGLNNPHWPIEFFWICGLPRFEGYISWNTGRVTVILLTPGFVSQKGSPWRFPVQDFSANSDPELNGWSRSGQPQGIIFVGQKLGSDTGPFVEMAGDPIAHHLDNSRGGIGDGSALPEVP